MVALCNKAYACRVCLGSSPRTPPKCVWSIFDRCMIVRGCLGSNATSVMNDFYYLSRSPYSFQVFGPLSVEVFPTLKYPLTPWLFGVSVTSSTATRRYMRVASASSTVSVPFRKVMFVSSKVAGCSCHVEFYDLSNLSFYVPGPRTVEC